MKILIIVTSVSRYRGRDLPTGLWLSELTHFYDAAKARGYEITIASPEGGAITLDPESLKPLLIDKLSKTYLADSAFTDLLQHTKAINEVAGQQFDCVYLTVGHGTMYDFPHNESLQAIIREQYESGRIVAAVCHGVGGLLNVKLSDGGYLIKGKDITGYSWFEETLARRKGAVPFNLEQSLKDRGANYRKAIIPMISNVREDGNLITGQNPFSSKAIAGKAMQRLAQPTNSVQ